MKVIISILLMSISLTVFCQEDLGYSSYRKLAKNQIREIKDDGAIILRVILNKKNADLYRKAGKTKVADRIEKASNKRNNALAKVLLDESFDFCKIYVIEAKDYGKVMNGQKFGYFLDKDLKVDSSIVLNADNVYFMEIGDVYESQKDFVDGENKTVLASSPVVQDALVIKDQNLNQLVTPFPFYVRLSMVNVNLDISDFSANNLYKDSFAFSDLDTFHKYLKDKYKFDKADLYLASKVFFLRKRLYNFYVSSLEPVDRKALKANK